MSERKAIVGWMTWPDYQMFVNEQPEGGFKWEFLDFKPNENLELNDFNTPIFIYTKKHDEQSEIDRLRAALSVAKDCIKLYDKAFDDTGNDYSHLICLSMARTLKDEIEKGE